MPKLICQKCNREMEDGNFYTYKNGKKTEMCKKCLTMHVNAFDESTFLWLLEKMDLPYIPAEWNVLRDKDFQKKGKDKFDSPAVFGKYLAKMKLNQWNKYCWADGPKLIEEAAAAAAVREEETAQKDAFYREMYEKGEISEAEFKTLTSVPTQREIAAGAPSNPYLGPDNPFDETKFLKEEELPDIAAGLTYDDKIYLAQKWGRLYRPDEWIELEKNYEEMMRSFDIQDADSINTLLLICKTNLKMNQALDNGDIEGFQKLSKVSEGLRKTAKFTAAQNKEAKGDFVDSVGELILMCERDGFIPRFCTDIPQDKVDQTLKDQKDYIYKLVTQDLGFGQQIEDALKKIEIQRQLEEEEKRRAEAAGDDYDPYNDVEELEDDDMIEYNDSIEEQREEDSHIWEDQEDGTE